MDKEGEEEVRVKIHKRREGEREGRWVRGSGRGEWRLGVGRRVGWKRGRGRGWGWGWGRENFFLFGK